MEPVRIRRYSSRFVKPFSQGHLRRGLRRYSTKDITVALCNQLTKKSPSCLETSPVEDLGREIQNLAADIGAQFENDCSCLACKKCKPRHRITPCPSSPFNTIPPLTPQSFSKPTHHGAARNNRGHPAPHLPPPTHPAFRAFESPHAWGRSPAPYAPPLPPAVH